MPSLFISRDAVSVRLRSERLELTRRTSPENGSQESLSVPLFDVERVVVCGRPAVTFPVLHELLKRKIPVILLSSRGRWLGVMDPGTRTNALRRVRQYEATSNAELRRRVASALVEAKIRNSRRVLQRLSASRGESAATAQKNASEALLRLRKSVRRGCFDLDSLRGMEGMAAACYFKRLADFFPEEAPFRERSRRPPLDAANALLSWTYSIVLGEIEACVRLHGLDPGIGFLHALEFSMPSLALDLLEPLRAPLCDSLALALLNRSILRKEHFRVSEEDGGTYLSGEGKPLFFMAYERAMTRKFVCRRGEPRVDFRRVLERQVCSVVRILEGGADADFFVMP